MPLAGQGEVGLASGDVKRSSWWRDVFGDDAAGDAVPLEVDQVAVGGLDGGVYRFRSPVAGLKNPAKPVMGLWVTGRRRGFGWRSRR